MTQKKKREDATLYRPTVANRMLPILAAGIIALIIAMTITQINTFEWDTFLPYLLLSLIMLLSTITLGCFYTVYHFIFNDRLILSPDGIDFVILGTSGFAEWDDMVEFDVRNIRLSQPIDVSHNTLKRLFSLGKGYRCIPVFHIIDIPQSLRGKLKLEEFAETDFGRDLYHYAPHLFDGKAKRLSSEDELLDEEDDLVADKLESRRR